VTSADISDVTADVMHGRCVHCLSSMLLHFHLFIYSVWHRKLHSFHNYWESNKPYQI